APPATLFPYTTLFRSLSTQPYKDGAAKALVLIDRLREQGHPIGLLNMGGGFGIHYRKQEARSAQEFAEVILPAVVQAKCRLVLRSEEHTSELQSPDHL